MNCEKARTLCIVNTLANLGHFPVRKTEKEAWFLSPFRSETQASFKVSRALNRWYDHGEGIGGNLIDLVCKMNSFSVQETLKFLQGHTSNFFFQPPPVSAKQQKKIIINRVESISHAALIDYLDTRKIQLSTVHQYIKEVHFTMNHKSFFAIGFQNDQRGWELRNSFQKLCSSPKAFTHLEHGNSNIVIFEGFFDFLSALILQPKWMMESDYMILNSLAFANKIHMKIKSYNKISLALDNDTAGNKITALIQKQYSRAVDCRKNFEGFKDINEKLKAWA